MYSFTRLLSLILALSLTPWQLALANDQTNSAPNAQVNSLMHIGVTGGTASDQPGLRSERFAREPSLANSFDDISGDSQAGGISGAISNGTLLARKQAKPSGALEQLPSEDPVPPTSLPLSKSALEVSKDLGILPLLERLDQLKGKFLRAQGETYHIDLLSIKQDLIESMLNVFLDTRDVEANIDADIARCDAVADYMEGRRDKGIRMNNIANFLIPQGAMAALATSAQNALQNFGNELEVVAAATTVLLSSYALHQAHGPKQSEETNPNMLASILGREPVNYDKYPPSVWAFLNDCPPGEKETRRQKIINGWIKLGRIKPLGQAGSAQELDQLCGTVPLRKAITIDLLRNRIPMLEDVRATMAGMSRDLRELTGFIRRP